MAPNPDSPKIAVVTGAARGIGAAIALRLAEDGHAVALLDRVAESCTEVAEQVRSRGVATVAVAADVSDEASVSAAIDQVTAELGAPTVLVNNAGILRDNLLFKMSADDWDAVSGVHLRGAFLMSKAVQPFMREAGFGRIVCLSSTSALGNRGQANYATAKAGLQGFVKTLALELGPAGITANAVAPGFIVTDMTRATAERVGQTFEQFAKAKADIIPVRRGGTPEDVAHTVSYLVDARSGFVNGQVIYVAGGPKC
jgi:3-oxoacyl-[acyl-carrier protein] reductase